MTPKVIQSPASWHTHEEKPDKWFNSVKNELLRIEKTHRYIVSVKYLSR